MLSFLSLVLLITLFTNPAVSQTVSTEKFTQLINSFTSEEEDVILAAKNALVRIADEAVIPLTTALRESDNPRIRCYAAWTLGVIGDSRATPVLYYHTLLDEEEIVQESSTLALLEIQFHPYLITTTDESIPQLPKEVSTSLEKDIHQKLHKLIFSNHNKFTRYRAFQLLRLIDEDEIKKFLKKTARKHPNPQLRVYAVELLEKTGDPAFINTLIEILNHDRSAAVRAKATLVIGSLGKIGKVRSIGIIKLEHRTNTKYHHPSTLYNVPSSSQYNKKIIGELIDRVKKDESPKVRENAVLALSDLTLGIIEEIKKLPQRRELINTAAGIITHSIKYSFDFDLYEEITSEITKKNLDLLKDIVKCWEKALSDETSSLVRKQIVSGADRLIRIIAPVTMMKVIKYPGLQRKHQATLHNIKKDITSLLLDNIRQEKDETVLISTVSALGHIKRTRFVIDRLFSLLDENYSLTLKLHIIEALEKLNGNIVEERLANLLVNPETPSQLRERIIFSFGKMESKSVTPLLINVLTTEEENLLLRVNTTSILGELGDKTAVPSLVNLLSEDNSDLRMIAVRSLGKIGDRSSLKPLIGILRTDQSPSVRCQAVTAIRLVDEKESIDILAKTLKDNNKKVCIQTVKELAKINDRRICDILFEAWREETDIEVRMAITKSLEEGKHFFPLKCEKYLRLIDKEKEKE